MVLGTLAACFLASAVIGAIVARLIPLVAYCFVLALVLFFSRYPDPVPAFTVLLFGMSLLFGRALRMIGSDLLAVFGELGFAKFSRLLLWAGALTLPVAVLAWLGGDFGRMRANVVLYGCGEEFPVGLYNQNPPVDSDILSVTGADGIPRLLARVDSTEQPYSSWVAPISSRVCAPPNQQFDLEASLVASVHQYTANLRVKLRSSVGEWVGKAQERGYAGADATTYALFGDGGACDGIIPSTIQKQPDGCGVITLTDPCKLHRWPFHIGECASRQVQYTVQKAIIQAYGRARDRFYVSWEMRQNELALRGQDAGTATLSATDLFLDLYLEPAEAASIDTIKFSIGFWNAMSWILVGWTVTVIAKVFIYVFARLGFAPTGGGLFLSLRPSRSLDQATPEMHLISSVFSFNRPLEQQAWFASRSGAVTWDNLQPLARLPRPGQLLLKRIVKGKLLWMKYQPSETLHEISGNHSHDFPVAEVRLPVGARVVIDLGRLEAFTEGVRLRTIFSARLSAFLQRRLFFTEVSGPGSILLSGREGTIWEVGQEGAPRAVEAQTVIAMDRYGVFGCLTGTDPGSLLMNAPTIYPNPNSKSLIAATAKPSGARAMFGWIRHIAFFTLG